MKINKQKSNKKWILGAVLTVVAIICMLFFFLFMMPKEELETLQDNDKNIPTVNENSKNPSSGVEDTTDTTKSEPTKTPGKTPAQYEGETTTDEPEYNNEQFRIPEEE